MSDGDSQRFSEMSFQLMMESLPSFLCHTKKKIESKFYPSQIGRDSIMSWKLISENWTLPTFTHTAMCSVQCILWNIKVQSGQCNAWPARLMNLQLQDFHQLSTGYHLTVPDHTSWNIQLYIVYHTTSQCNKCIILNLSVLNVPHFNRIYLL